MHEIFEQHPENLSLENALLWNAIGVPSPISSFWQFDLRNFAQINEKQTLNAAAATALS